MTFPAPPRFLKKKESDKEEDPLLDMDPWTTVMVQKLVPPLLNPQLTTTDDDLAQPVEAGPQATAVLLKTNNLGVEFKNLKKDISCGNFPLGQWVKLKLMQSAIELQDIFKTIAEDEVAPLLAATQLDQVLPPPNVAFDNPTTDAALTRQAFYGLASHRLVQVSSSEAQQLQQESPAILGNVDVAFKVDLLAMNKYDVRTGFAKYGACAYFDQHQAPVAIRTSDEQLVFPSDDGYKWQVAKFAWRSSLITLVTAVDHLYGVHFAVAAQMLRASTETLPADHAVKRALQPFLFRTALINNKAGTALLPKHSILHHITALTWESLNQLAEDFYLQGPEWKPLPAFVATKGERVEALVQEGKLPFYQDGLELYACFKDFFAQVIPPDTSEQVVQDDETLQKFWAALGEYTSSPDDLGPLSRENLLSALANFAFHVCVQHEQVGSIREHLDTPLHGGFRIMHNAIQVDKQSYLGGLCLLAMTSLKTPALLSEFANFWQSDQERTRWKNLQTNLKSLAERIEQRNQTRVYPFQAANPTRLECSVSV